MVNELKKLLVLTLTMFSPLLIVLILVWWSNGLLGFLVLRSYVTFASVNSLVVIISLFLYVLMLNGWRYYALRLFPLPFLFLKIGLRWFVYLLLVYGVISFL